MTNNIMRNSMIIKECSLLITATGKRAKNISELIEELKSVEPESINYHFWGTKLLPRFEEPEYNNDFAAWASDALHNDKLAERLSMINPCDIELEELRTKIIDTLSQTDRTLGVTPDQQFHFKSSRTVIFNTGHNVSTIQDLARVLPELSTEAVYYHFIETKQHAEKTGDDIIEWLRGFGESSSILANTISKLNPYFYSLTEIRSKLSTTFNEYLRGNG